MEMSIIVDNKSYRYEILRDCIGIIMESVWENISVIPYNKQKGNYENIDWGSKYHGVDATAHYMDVRKLQFYMEHTLSLYSPVPISESDTRYRGYISGHTMELIKKHIYKLQKAIITKTDNEANRHSKRRNKSTKS